MNRYREISDFARAFSSEYKGFMKANDITNLQLAERLGRNDGYISERANGKRPIDADDVDALASLVPGWTGRELMMELARRVRASQSPQDAERIAPVIVGRFDQNVDVTPNDTIDDAGVVELPQAFAADTGDHAADAPAVGEDPQD